MATEISTGTITTSGTTTYVSGTSSGLDTDSLVENAVAAYTAEADTIDVKVEENDEIIAAYEEYYGLATAVQDSLETLKSITGYSSSETNVFESRTATLSSTGVDATNLISATIDDDAPIGEYELTIVQKAEEMAVQGSTLFSSTDEAVSLSGEFTIGLTEMEAATITVDEDMSLQDIVDAINETTEESGVEASVLKVSETEYQLVITGTETNQEISVSTSDGDILYDLGLTEADGATFLEDQIIQEPQGSIVLYGNTQITRDDNSYDDLIDGVSFDIEAADEDTTITMTVDYDSSSAKEAVEAFVEAYNALREFFITNQTVNSDGSIPDEAVLFSDSLVETLGYSLSTVLAGASYSDSDIQTLGDLGLSFDDDNLLVIDDETALDDALLNSFDDVMDFFTSSITTSSSSLGVITNDSVQQSLDFEIAITMDEDGNIASATVDGSSAAFEISGTRLIGAEGSIYEGLTLAYVGDEDATISISMQAGIADLLYNTIDTYTNATDGLINEEISLLGETNDDLEAEAEEIREKGEELREKEIEKYSEMETKIALAKSLLATIQALLGTSDDD